jgi:hypothetical protein
VSDNVLATTPVPRHTGHNPTVLSSFSMMPYQQPSVVHLGVFDNTGSLFITSLV